MVRSVGSARGTEALASGEKQAVDKSFEVRESMRSWPRFLPWAVVVIVVPVVVVWWFCSAGATTVLVVRHAEKSGSGDVDLSPAGFARADALAHVVAKASLDAIYTTNLKRTRQTADPTETATGLTATEFGPFEVEALVGHLLDNHSGGTVLVVAHSNTVDDIVDRLGGPAIDELDEDEFDSLFVVTRRCCWQADLSVLQYGESSP